jgi:hypothetical protein
MGTTIMGTDPTKSVVEKGLPGAALFPDELDRQPAALALRAAETIKTRLKAK